MHASAWSDGASGCPAIRYGVDAGAELLALAGDAPTIAVIGTAKNVGKTTASGALCAALREPYGVVSAGRDGEVRDELDARSKPRLHLGAGTLFATARSLLPRHPACEIVAVTAERGALGPIVLARARTAGDYEIAGPSGAAALRRIVEALFAAGARRTIVDGALDRIAALREGDAIVAATGAAAAPSLGSMAGGIASLVRKLQTRPFDPLQPHLFIDGALTSESIAELERCGEQRQVVVADATRIVARGALRLDVRVRRAFNVVACTVASATLERSIDPRRLLEAVAAATGLPALDVLAGARA